MVVVIYPLFILMGIGTGVYSHRRCTVCGVSVCSLTHHIQYIVEDCVNERINTHPYGFIVTFNSTVHVKGCKSITFTVHLTSCVFLFITLVHSFPDVSLDTLARDAYRLSRSGCPCPIQVCSLDMSSWEQRHSCHWITSVDSSCPPPPHPSLWVFLPLSPPLSLSQVNTQWAVHCTTYTVVPSMGTLCFCCS